MIAREVDQEELEILAEYGITLDPDPKQNIAINAEYDGSPVEATGGFVFERQDLKIKNLGKMPDGDHITTVFEQVFLVGALSGIEKFIAFGTAGNFAPPSHASYPVHQVVGYWWKARSISEKIVLVWDWHIASSVDAVLLDRRTTPRGRKIVGAVGHYAVRAMLSSDQMRELDQFIKEHVNKGLEDLKQVAHDQDSDLRDLIHPFLVYLQENRYFDK